MSAGDVAGYFFALLTVIGVLPLIFVLIRYYRKQRLSQRFEDQLENSAIKYMMEYRHKVIQQNLENQRRSFSHKSKQLLKENSVTQLLTNSGLSTSDQDHFDYLMRQQQTFWGIEDLFVKEGKISYGNNQIIRIPKGLLEDFIYYVCNNINPITFLFASDKHPQSLISRFVCYTTAQSFVLFLYLIVENSTLRLILNIVFSPLTILVEYWLNIMLLCPCVPKVSQEEEDDANTDNNSTTSPTQQSPPSPSTRTPSTQSQIIHKTLYHTLRVVGWVLAFPVLFFLVFFLVVIATLLANNFIKPEKLGLFILDGILIPFLIKIALVVTDFLWFIHPTHVLIFGIRVLTINSWTEIQTNEYLLHHSTNLTKQQIQEELQQRRKASYSEVDLCHCTCHCYQCIGYHRDSHYTLAICEPSCYYSRCFDGLNAWYWEEEKEEAQALLPSPIRYSLSVSNPLPSSPPLETDTEPPMEPLTEPPIEQMDDEL